jgi:hypothetical protein
LAKWLLNDDDPDEETMGEAVWLYSDLVETLAGVVTKGIGKAFSKS